MSRYTFSTMITRDYVPGAKALISSIGRYHPGSEVFVFCGGETVKDKGGKDFVDADFVRWCAHRKNAWVRLFDFRSPALQQEVMAMWAKLLPSVAHPEYHYHHPEHVRHPAFPDTREFPGAKDGLDHLHWFHPLNFKAHATAYMVEHGLMRRLVHIDSDAFLLGPIDAAFENHPADTVIGWHDDYFNPMQRCALLEYRTDLTRAKGLNAGIVFYHRGPLVDQLTKELSFWVDCPYHWNQLFQSSGDQGILRHLVVKYRDKGLKLVIHKDGDKLPPSEWNPTHGKAKNLRRLGDVWLNDATGRRQFMWHAARFGHPLTTRLFDRNGAGKGMPPGIFEAFWELMED